MTVWDQYANEKFTRREPQQAAGNGTIALEVADLGKASRVPGRV